MAGIRVLCVAILCCINETKYSLSLLRESHSRNVSSEGSYTFWASFKSKCSRLGKMAAILLLVLCIYIYIYILHAPSCQFNCEIKDLDFKNFLKKTIYMVGTLVRRLDDIII